MSKAKQTDSSRNNEAEKEKKKRRKKERNGRGNASVPNYESIVTLFYKTKMRRIAR
jgi:hypothetical protein